MSAAAFGAGTGLYIYKTSRLSGIRYFAYSFFAISFWAFANSLELLAPGLDQKVFLTKVSYLGIVATTPLLFNFAAVYTGRSKFLGVNWQVVIWAVPLFVLLTAFSNELHYFQWKSYRLTESLAGKVVYYESGPGVFIIVAYSYALMIASYVFLIRYFMYTHRFYKRQIFLMLLSLMIPWALNFTYITRINPVPELDLAPVGVIISDMIILLAIWRFRLLQLLPHAKDILFDSIPDPIFVVDTRMNITDYNPSASRLITGQELLGKSIFEMLSGLTIDPVRSFDGNKEFSIIKNGEVNWFDVSISGIKSKAGALEGYLVVLRNITRRKKDDEKVRESEAKLRELNASKDKFFSIIAHDLKNPFSNLINIARILQEERNEMSEEETNTFIDMVSNISNNSYELLENLLQWSRSQTGSIRYLPIKVTLSELINHSLDEIKYSAVQKSISLVKPEEIKGNVECDPNMINVVLRNLLMNAIKFSYPGGSVEVGYKEREEDFEIFVKDEGTGMSKQVKAGLFRIGYSQSRTGTANERGTGLGLILCREFIEKNLGEIKAESEEGKGSVFYISLPKTKN